MTKGHWHNDTDRLYKFNLAENNKVARLLWSLEQWNKILDNWGIEQWNYYNNHSEYTMLRMNILHE